ncbi:putative disease resistance RPP13-like protein 1 [Papaver somniferum]|uniref:putative disease resistance RPP13-like protein 1 n=1 Tax=Papaver somniferum TaxID=3469 RepID=UPI000E700B20|nr:putative disease resistance RPP13-like protein 1 [Papaver somniferum]XP_026432195.1 putative disease resistance RPP13-like protein 1 [Papaver somniferum]XP_026432196.1 putative disease resistance RPP13-like protein 1 [Papaver somniferum]
MAIVEGIVANGVTEILKKLIPVIAQEIRLAWGVKDELEKLQKSLQMILAVLADAESRQVKEDAVRVWLIWLKDVAYDADDVMGEFAYETLRRGQRGDRSRHKLLDFVSPSNNPLGFSFKMVKKIKDINGRLDEISKEMNRFGLQAAAVNTSVVRGESSEQRSRQTASFINDSETVGRKDDVIKIVDVLTKANKSSSSDVNYHSSEKVSVISIVGMGGLGKTTLAQLVYKDESVKKYFDQRIWICVSTDFDVEKILMKIMESITLEKFDNLSNYDLLVNRVRENLQGKKFLLVLDDLWSEDIQQWERLKDPLLVGAQGSKILITTRNMQVAHVVKGGIPPYRLEGLQEDKCWCIIEKRAFSPGGAEKTSNMTSIGKEISKKCSGLPLAAKFLGSLMHSKNKESDWLSIRETDVWNAQEGQNEIRPILKLSYDNLSPHLKQCFSYCSIFPKGWVIKRETLIHLWMAEGFLDSCNVGKGRYIEDVADAYFENLVGSSFLDAAEKSLLGNIKTCKMHDLVHDLAKDVAGNQEVASLKVSELNDNTSKIRRLQLILDVDLSATSLKSLSNSEKLRTVFIPEGSKLDPFMLSENNQYLRILHVERGSPIAIGRLEWRSLSVLKHLRYLRLSCLSLREVKNDQSISKLYNLETLVLNIISDVQSPLSNIQSLKKLRYLEVSQTDMVELPDSVTSLSNLQTLDLNNCYLKVIPDSISGLKNLRFLNLSFNRIEELPISIITLSNLETLDVNSCKKLKALPESVKGLSRLRIFVLKNCPLLKELPEDLGTLTQLRYLSLEGTQIRVLPESCVNLNNIEYVNLSECEVPIYVKNWTNLREFSSESGNILGAGDLIFLERLVYSVPKKYTINEAERNVGIEELSNLNFLQELSIYNLENVEDPADAESANLKGKQNLHELFLHWSSNSSQRPAEVFEALQPPTCLRKLNIMNFRGQVFPDWMCVPSGLPNLVLLALFNCAGIKTLPDIGGFPSLIELRIINMFLLEEFRYSCASLQDLTIRDCKSLTEIPSFPSLAKLLLDKVDLKLVCSVGRSQTSLTELQLFNIEDLIYFPVSILENNSNLRNLVFKECNQLKGFGVNENGLLFKNTILGSLQILVLIDCPDLKFLPDFRGWTSLRVLLIFNCPQVKESLTYDLKSLSFLQTLRVDFIQRDEQLGDPSTWEDLINLLDKSYL